ncbi:MAG: AAA-like domain-containing protein [Candidatus Competibacter sp.]|nr:AAA-like domain-containing protein [Candidatus Competibacter sp.]
MNKPKLFKIETSETSQNEETQQNEPFLCWDDNSQESAYKVIRLGSPHKLLDLPGDNTFLDKQAVIENQHTLVFGGHSSGTRTFLEWWCHILDIDKQVWVICQSTDLDWEYFQKSSQIGNSDQDNQVKFVIEALFRNRADNNVEINSEFNNWARNLKKPFNLIIRDLSAIGTNRALQIATTLRRLTDQKIYVDLEKYKNFRFLVTDNSDFNFRDIQDRSGLSSVTYHYRLPTFSEDEIQFLAKNLSIHFLENEKTLEQFHQYTGGHPLLVKSLLDRLKHLTGYSSETTVTKALILRACQQLRDSPPDQVRFWQKDLTDILERDGELISTMEAYVTGTTIGQERFPPPLIERPLFIAGWLGLNCFNRWGISSRFHANLARPVLDKLRGRDS